MENGNKPYFMNFQYNNCGRRYLKSVIKNRYKSQSKRVPNKLYLSVLFYFIMSMMVLFF